MLAALTWCWFTGGNLVYIFGQKYFTAAGFSVAGFAVALMLDGLLDPIWSHEFNARIPDSQRATVLSLRSAGVSVLMIVTFPAASYLQPVNWIYVATGGVALVLATAWALRWRPRPTAPLAPAESIN